MVGSARYAAPQSVGTVFSLTYRAAYQAQCSK